MKAAYLAIAIFAISICVLAETPSTINYQGRLVEDGDLVNGSREVLFQLYDASAGGSNLFTEIDIVAVSDGLFSTAVGDSDENTFARALSAGAVWLQVSVGGSALGDRQQLIAAPYAIQSKYASGIRIDGTTAGRFIHAESFWGPAAPIVIMGAATNGVDATSIAATVGGGYNQSIDRYAYYSTIGGGTLNAVSSNTTAATISGGYFNEIEVDAEGAAIAGGYSNDIGERNHKSAIGGGWQNYIHPNSSFSVIAGGIKNEIYGSGSVIAGGGGHRYISTNDWSTTSYRPNEVHADLVSIGGGGSNEATTNATYSTIPGGFGAKTDNYGQLAYASGPFGSIFSDRGSAQACLYVMRNTTSGSLVSTNLYLDGQSERLTLNDAQTLSFSILVAARSMGGSSAGYEITGLIENDGGTTQLIGTPGKTVLGEDRSAWDVSVSANDTYNSLEIDVVGESSYWINWVARVQTVEVVN